MSQVYNELLFEINQLEEQYKYDTHTLKLLRSVHNLILVEAKYEEIVVELFNVLRQIKGYKDGWNEAVDSLEKYQVINYI